MKRPKTSPAQRSRNHRQSPQSATAEGWEKTSPGTGSPNGVYNTTSTTDVDGVVEEGKDSLVVDADDSSGDDTGRYVRGEGNAINVKRALLMKCPGRIYR